MSEPGQNHGGDAATEDGHGAERTAVTVIGTQGAVLPPGAEELVAGARLAVDDVGAGYASLRHILRLDPNLIKLDLSLTRNIQNDRRKRALAASLISFAHETGCAVIAEGIEQDGEKQALIELGADYGQGYFLGRPGPLPEGDWAAPV